MPLPASFPSRSRFSAVRPAWRAVLLCWIALFSALFGPGRAGASFTRPSFTTAPLVATAKPTQGPWDQPFTLEITTGLVCGNDPVNRHDPLGLAQLRISDDISQVARINPVTGQPECSYGEITGILSWLSGNRTYTWQTPNSEDLKRLFNNNCGKYELNDPYQRAAAWNRQWASASKTIPDQVTNGLKTGVVLTAAGVTGGLAGGGAYGFLIANGARAGYATAGSLMAGGLVGDLTTQGGENLTGQRSGFDLNQTINSTGVSLALGMGGYGVTKGIGLLFSSESSGLFGARGPISGRDFNPANAGGRIFRLTTKNIKVSLRGIDYVEQHVARFGPDAANSVMIRRLRSIAAGKLEATAVDLNFYTHELREFARYRNLGWRVGQPNDPMAARELWNNTHTATLEDYGLAGDLEELYHPDALIF